MLPIVHDQRIRDFGRHFHGFQYPGTSPRIAGMRALNRFEHPCGLLPPPLSFRAKGRSPEVEKSRLLVLPGMPFLSVQHPVLALHARELVEQRLCHEQQGDERRRPLHAVHGKAGEVDGHDAFRRDGRDHEEQRARVEDGAGHEHDEDAAACGKPQTRRDARVFACDDPAAGKGAEDEAAEPEGEHLPGCPGTLPEDEVARQRRERADEKAGRGPEGEPSDHDDGRHGLEARQPDERRARRHRERGHDREHDELARLGPSTLEDDEEGRDGAEHHDDARHHVGPATRHGADDHAGRGAGKRHGPREHDAATRTRPAAPSFA